MGTVTFALHELGWSDFQSLCDTICRETLGQTVVGYLDSNDGGRDGAFTGVWNPKAGETFCGEFVIQVKHTTRPETTLSLSDLADELDKAEWLAKSGRCDVYLLMTNARMTARTEERLKSALLERDISQSRALGSTWINKTISESPRLRMLVPRLYGLGDLTQILDQRAYEQAQAVLDSMRTDLAKLVRTTTYEKAARALHDHGFVLLAGAPATGKTTIAGQLALAAADVFDTHVVMLDDASEFSERWNPHERQMFWLDDAFGTTQFTAHLAHSWQRITPKVTSAIDRGSKFVLTTRSYILRHALKYLKRGSFPLFDEAQVVVDVADLTPSERRQILYNHLKHGRQSETFLQQLVPHLEAAAAHPGFTPELARRLAEPAFTKHLEFPSAKNIPAFFEHPRQLLADTFAGLDDHSLSALGLIFVSRGWLPSPITRNEPRDELLMRLGSTIGDVTRALEHLKGSLVAHVFRDGQSGWVFAHPTMIDAYADQLRSPELLPLLIEGFDTDVLMTRTTCGDTGFRNAIVLPEPVWPTVIDRLSETLNNRKSDWRQRDRCMSYLAGQCAPAFQGRYLQRHPHLLDELSEPGLMLEVDAGNYLIASLHRNGILPEHIRAGFVQSLIGYCTDGTDGAVLWDSDLRAMLTDEEQRTLRTRLMTELVPHPESILHNLPSSVSEDEDLHQLTWPIMEFAEALVAEFDSNETVLAAATALEAAREDWLTDHGWSDDREDDQDYYGEPLAARPQAHGDRSVFDDLVGDHP